MLKKPNFIIILYDEDDERASSDESSLSLSSMFKLEFMNIIKYDPNVNLKV